MKLLNAYKEAFKTSAALIAIVALYAVGGSLDDDSPPSELKTWLRGLTSSNAVEGDAP